MLVTDEPLYYGSEICGWAGLDGANYLDFPLLFQLSFLCVIIHLQHRIWYNLHYHVKKCDYQCDACFRGGSL